MSLRRHPRRTWLWASLPGPPELSEYLPSASAAFDPSNREAGHVEGMDRRNRQKNADKEDADKEKIPINPSMRCRVTEKQDYEERLQDALEAVSAGKDEEATQTARKRKADEEPVERIQKKAKAVTEREVSPRSKATTRAQRRVSNRKTKLRHH